jgi:uncharacterized protein YpbB
MKSHQQFMLPVLLVWLLPNLVQTFTVSPVHNQRHVMTTIKSTVLNDQAQEKMTKEARELMETFQAKESGHGPELMIAQVAPSVR